MDISILIPSHNCAKYLAAALDSALRQTYPVREIVVANDASTDNTDEVIAPYLAKYPNIRYSKVNFKSIPEVRNYLVREAACDVLCWLDADDLWTEDKLALQVEKMEREHCDMVLCDIENFYDEAVTDPTGAQRLLHDTPMRDLINGMLVRRSVYDTVGLYDPKHNTCTEDVDWNLRSKAAGIPTGRVEKPCYLRRVHATNCSTLLNYDSMHALHMIAGSLRGVRRRKE